MNIISKKYIATSSIVVLGSLVIQRALPYADRNGLFLLLLIGCILYSSYQFSAAKRQTQRNKDKSGSETTAAIPIAPGAVPLLGHALAYKDNPAEFLRRCVNTCGPIFRINLAGQSMVAVAGIAGAEKSCDSCPIQQVSRFPEATLSARDAVAEMGFDYTLGENNVYSGTIFHRGCLKKFVHNKDNGRNINDTFVVRIARALQEALTLELEREKIRSSGSGSPQSPLSSDQPDVVYVSDLFALTRRTVLRALVCVLVGTCLVLDESDTDNDICTSKPTILDDMMVLEDEIEDATAKAAVLPRWLSVPIVLQPVKRQRQRLEKRIASAIQREQARRRVRCLATPATNANREESNSDNSNEESRRWGPWLVGMEQSKKSCAEFSELIVGLLFAAHKNPAIATAQSLCLLLDPETKKVTTDPTDKTRNTRVLLYDACAKEAAALGKASAVAQEKMFTGEDDDDSTNTNKNDPSTTDRNNEISSALEEAVHLKQCVCETLRLSAHSIGAVRKVRRPIQLSATIVRGNSSGEGDSNNINAIPTSPMTTSAVTTTKYAVKTGETIAVLHNATNTDARFWGPDALTYRPSRYQQQCSAQNNDDAAPSTIGLHDQQLLQEQPPLRPTASSLATFSHGVHKCPGERVALTVIQLLLAQLLERNVRLEEPMPAMCFERATLAQRARPVAVSLEQR